MTGPSSGDQNQYYRQQEERAEKTREQARSLRGDDPEEPTEIAGSAAAPDPDQSRDARQSSGPDQSPDAQSPDAQSPGDPVPDAQSSDVRSSGARSAGPGSRTAGNSGDAESTEEGRGS